MPPPNNKKQETKQKTKKKIRAVKQVFNPIRKSLIGAKEQANITNFFIPLKQLILLLKRIYNLLLDTNTC